MNPDKMAKIVHEIRSTFIKDSDIELETLGRMKYLNACIEEGLRAYPPVPVGLPRVTPETGLVVCGEHIPHKVRLLKSLDTCLSIFLYNSFLTAGNK
jgi:cytochrome P450